MIFISLALFTVFIIAAGFALRVANPGLGFEATPDFSFQVQLIFKIFLSTLAMASIQFFISQHSKNIILPLGIGIAGVISFLILSQGWEYSPYHPYGYSILASNGLTKEGFNLWADMNPVYRSLLVATVMFTASGVYQLRKKNYLA